MTAKENGHIPANIAAELLKVPEAHFQRLAKEGIIVRRVRKEKPNGKADPEFTGHGVIFHHDDLHVRIPGVTREGIGDQEVVTGISPVGVLILADSHLTRARAVINGSTVGVSYLGEFTPLAIEKDEALETLKKTTRRTLTSQTE